MDSLDSTSVQANGTWVFDGERPFPGHPSLCARRYVWRDADGFEIAFLVPIEDGPRRFFAERTLSAWVNKSVDSRFVDDVCLHGIPTAASVAELEALISGRIQFDEGSSTSKADPMAALQFFHAIFRQRSCGTESLDRKLFLMDLFDRPRPDTNRTCIIPGAPEGLGEYTRAGQVVAVVREAFFRDVPIGYERTSGPDRQFSISGYGPLAELFVDGMSRDMCWDEHMVRRTWQAISRVTVGGLDLCEDLKHSAANPAELNTFVERLAKGAATKSAEQFDQWIQNERARKWHRLLPDYRPIAKREKAKVKGRATGVIDEMKERATRYFRLTQWHAHQQMGICFGAVLTKAWLSLMDSTELALTLEEGRSFRSLNLPQLHLAGLPLAFLPFGALSWVMPQILTRTNGPVSPAYDQMTATMIGLFAETVLERRQLDTERKRSRPNDVPNRKSARERGVGPVCMTDHDNGTRQFDIAITDPDPQD